MKIVLLLAAILPVILPPSGGDQGPKYRPARSDYGKVHSAWEYTGPWHLPIPPDLKLVAADIELPDPPGGSFDPDDIDIFDADSGESFGSDPWIQRLTPEGEFVADDDPAVKERRDYRGVFIWAVSRNVRRVNFGYWGEMLFVHPVALSPTGKVVPKPALEVVSIGPFGAVESYERHLALLHARDWSRTMTPANYTLFAPRGASDGDICGCDAWLEVDGAGRPVDGPASARPYYQKERWFLADFWCPSGRSPEALNLFGTHTPLPKAAPPAVPAATLERLAAADRNRYARHRRSRPK